MGDFTRVNFRNKTADMRACESCAFVERRTYDPERPGEPGKSDLRCHRNPPVKQADGHEHIFPVVGAGDRCGEWRRDDGAPRSEGTPHRWRCDTSPAGIAGRRRATVA